MVSGKYSAHSHLSTAIDPRAHVLLDQGAAIDWRHEFPWTSSSDNKAKRLPHAGLRGREILGMTNGDIVHVKEEVYHPFDRKPVAPLLTKRN